LRLTTIEGTNTMTTQATGSTGNAGGNDTGTDDKSGSTSVTVKTGTDSKATDTKPWTPPSEEAYNQLTAQLEESKAGYAQLEQEKKDAELSKLPELERYKTMSEALEKENKELREDNMRRQVAMEADLPWGLACRLKGKTLTEMRADAAELTKDYTPARKRLIPEDDKNKAKTNDQAKGGKTGKPGMNEALRALAGRG
jgi:hypothetical protein